MPIFRCCLKDLRIPQNMSVTTGSSQPEIRTNDLKIKELEFYPFHFRASILQKNKLKHHCLSYIKGMRRVQKETELFK